MPDVYIKTYGCQMNQQDSMTTRRLLACAGYEFVASADQADLLLINTCTIREKAYQKLASELGRLRRYKEINPQVKVGVLGCVAQQEKEKLFQRFSYLDLVVGPDEIANIPALVQKLTQGQPRHELAVEISSRQDFEFVSVLPESGESLVSAYVNVQKGCDKMCSFCIVPFVRGREVSRPADEILAEVKVLSEMGVKEVTLLGQNVNAYGAKGGENTVPFVELLRRIAGETALERLRFTTSHPSDMSQDLVRCYRDLKILCPHLHLPVQSGSDRVLKLMRRHYDIAFVEEMVMKLRAAREDFCFTTDLIVGFPGETETDFLATLSFMTRTQLDHSFAFIFSPRPMTKAAELTDPVTIERKKARLEELMVLQRELSLASNQRWLNRPIEVLVEQHDGQERVAHGRTLQNRPIHFSTPIDPVGQILPVYVTKALPNSLVGEMVQPGNA